METIWSIHPCLLSFWARLSKSSCSLYKSQFHFFPPINPSSRHTAVKTVPLSSKPQPEDLQIHTNAKFLTLFMATGPGHHSWEELKRLSTFWNTQQKNSSRVQEEKHCTPECMSEAKCGAENRFYSVISALKNCYEQHQTYTCVTW